MNLSRKNLGMIRQRADGSVPADKIFDLPEKILQFGTGVLLRALPDYFVDKANRLGIFNGRILVVKSTASGDTEAFEKQDNLYSLITRGVQDGKSINKRWISAAISRVMSATGQWKEILDAASNPELRIVISNTTEVGLQLVMESIYQDPPASFPAKLLAFLHRRFAVFGGAADAGMVIIPTELIPDNGKLLKSILFELCAYNKLEPAFVVWLDRHNRFCSSLVDRIVPGKPDAQLKTLLEEPGGYTDDLMTICEPYRLWAIEGDASVRALLSFHTVDKGVVITPDITRFRELKLRMLNATHTLSCGFAFLSGFRTVRAAMEDEIFETYIRSLMMDEIGQAIPVEIPTEEIREFGRKVLDRFRNPYLQHQWISITMQYSSKIAKRVVPVLQRYVELYRRPPELICMGFAAYLLFMRPVKKEGDQYFGILDNQYYPIQDDRAGYFHGLWEERTVDHIVQKVLSNTDFWNDDLTRLEGFADCVTRKMKNFIRSGTMHEISEYHSPVK
jgi:tagaturonate reductase